ncbi:MAG: hypothetical protein AB8W08_01625 [Coxiella endosymbiont of Dermacentor silvarum]
MINPIFFRNEFFDLIGSRKQACVRSRWLMVDSILLAALALNHLIINKLKT